MASASTPSSKSTPKPEPILASALLEDLLARQERNYRAKNKSQRVRTGCRELDEYVLLGGVERGVVLGISSEGERSGEDGGEDVGMLISLNLLVTALLESPRAKASILDTVGSFPVSILAQIIRRRITAHRSVNQRQGRIETVDQGVKDILGRVAISRVFDVEGIWELLSEISRECAGNTESRTWHNPRALCLENQPKRNLVDGLPVGDTRGRQQKDIEIRDSQEEEDDENETDSELDLNLSGTMDVFIISNITTPINELFSRHERSVAHTLVSSLTRSLQTITQTHSLLTILLNTLTRPAASVSTAKSATGTAYPQTHSSSLPPIRQGVSVFTSTTARPSLGKIFDEIVGNGLSLMVSRVPRNRKDAEILYRNSKRDSNSDAKDDDNAAQRDDAEAGPESYKLKVGRTTKTAQMSHVIEVLRDRVPDYDFWMHQISLSPPLPLPRPHPSNQQTDQKSRLDGNRIPFHGKDAQGEEREGTTKGERRPCRTQRWAAFDLSAADDDGMGLVPVPGPAGAGVGIRAGEMSQMHLVKQFPFGRRV